MKCESPVLFLQADDTSHNPAHTAVRYSVSGDVGPPPDRRLRPGTGLLLHLLHYGRLAGYLGGTALLLSQQRGAYPVLTTVCSTITLLYNTKSVSKCKILDLWEVFPCRCFAALT